MNKRGVRGAIPVADGLTELASPDGVQYPSISDWARTAAEHALPTDAGTVAPAKASTTVLSEEQPDEMDGIDAARVQEYGLLAVLLSRPPDAALLSRIAAIHGDSTPLGAAHTALASAAASVELEKVEREYFDLFVGLGRGELLPYGSYYQTGFLNERPLARLRQDLQLLGIERVEAQMEPEDHVALLCEIMAGLIGGRFGASLDAQQMMFERHLGPWIGRFFADLERVRSVGFYRHVGAVGRLFIEIEREAFALPA
jgi:TorA maturation chaperone TorD